MNRPTEYLYNLLPAIYRMRDAEQGYPLRGDRTVGVHTDGLALDAFLLGELGPPGRLERLDRLRALLRFLPGDLADLVVGERVTEFLLAVRDRGREHAEGAELDLLAGLQRGGHLVVDLRRERAAPGVGHRTLLACFL